MKKIDYFNEHVNEAGMIIYKGLKIITAKLVDLIKRKTDSEMERLDLIKDYKSGEVEDKEQIEAKLQKINQTITKLNDQIVDKEFELKKERKDVNVSGEDAWKKWNAEKDKIKDAKKKRILTLRKKKQTINEGQTNKTPEQKKNHKPESFKDQYKRRVIKTTKPEHIKKGLMWRIKGKDRDEISIKLYKEKPNFDEFKKQLKRVAGHEFSRG